jgi:hypothetical protein
MANMSNTHEALKLAEILEANARSGTVTDSDDERKTAAMLRASHALIVQMAEALSGVLNIRNDSHGVAGYHLNGEMERWDGFPEVSAADEAHAAATQYLKGQQ